MKMQTLGFFHGIGKTSFVSLSKYVQVSQNDEVVHKSPVIECLMAPLHVSIKDSINTSNPAAAVPCLWPSLAGTALACPQGPPELYPQTTRISSSHLVCCYAP